jgi:CubicO group peptidase (beta-lactamase class C family)
MIANRGKNVVISGDGMRISLKVLILVVLGAVTFTGALRAAAPTARPEEVGLSSERLKRIGELMQREIAAKNFAGAVTLVARSGRIAHFETHGLMDLDSKKPMQKDAIFRIMSMTKPIVGTAIMMLVEDGKVRLTDPVSKFIPELQGLSAIVVNTDGRVGPAASFTFAAPLPGRAVPVEREVMIRDLLTHTSGLMSGGMSASSVNDVSPKSGESLAQIMSRLKKVPLDFQPGTRWAYSPQFGFDVLVRVAEIASGMPFDQFAKQRIFDPLGMKDTFFYPADGNPRIATLYEQAGGSLRKAANPTFMNGSYVSGGGGLFSTAEDYLQFALMLLNRGQLDGKRLLGTKTVDLMSSVVVPDTLPGRNPGEGFGLSVRVVSDPGSRNTLVSKGTFGWSGAFNTHVFIDPVEHLVGIFMTQSAYLSTRGELREDFETAVMQAVVGGSAPGGTN